jgi:hypothetical protein
MLLKNILIYYEKKFSRPWENERTSCKNIMKNFPKITGKNKVGTPNVLAVFFAKKV